MVSLTGGTVSLRDARTRTSRTVALQPFTLARTSVTWRQFSTTPSWDQHRLNDPLVVRDPAVPAHGVSWQDAVVWCIEASKQLGLRPAYRIDGNRVEWDTGADGFRLPTEAEWEYACRGGTDGPHYGPLAEIAWTSLDLVHAPQPVGTKQANTFGLDDMLGNVWEWVWDHADTARYGDYRVLRGGRWADRPWNVRASVRRGSAPDAVIDDVGFRVARGAVTARGADERQGWSRNADAQRANSTRPRPIGWTPLDPALQ